MEKQDATKDAAPKMTAAEAYRKWVADLPKIRETFLASLGGHSISSVEVRVDNFLGQLAHELKDAAMSETFPAADAKS
jgi:prophage antirepressor-like protein